jgi:hypothetical protein
LLAELNVRTGAAFTMENFHLPVHGNRINIPAFYKT